MATSKDPSASPTAAKAPAKPGCLVLEVFWRTSERAPLHKMVCWTAMLTNSRAWRIIEQIRSLLSATGLGRHQDLTASVEEAQRVMGLARLAEEQESNSEL